MAKKKMTPELKAALMAQREAFWAKFGRYPGPDDPVFFDPDADTPTSFDEQEMMSEIIVAMRTAGLPPEFEYAYRKTGLLGIGNDKSQWPPEHVAEWDAALREYHEERTPAFTEEQKERWTYSRENPAFEGVYEFDITFEMFGEKVTRLARAKYEFTPEWEYFDLKKKAPHLGWASWTTSLEILAVPESDDDETDEMEDNAEDTQDEKPPWVQLADFIEEGVMSRAMWDRLDDAIEERCKAEDVERRKRAKRERSGPKG